MSLQNQDPLRYSQVAMACIKWMKLRKFDAPGSIAVPEWALREFAQLLGFKMIHRPHVYLFPLDNPEVKRLIDLINGPYGLTILKMLEIKRRNPLS